MRAQVSIFGNDMDAFNKQLVESRDQVKFNQINLHDKIKKTSNISNKISAFLMSYSNNLKYISDKLIKVKLLKCP